VLIHLVEEAQGVAEVAAALGRSAVVGVDTEFHGEHFYVPRLMLLQIATPQAVYLVDPLARVDIGPVLDALDRPGLCVVGHALRNDLLILARRYGVLPSKVFDTQIAAAFLGLGRQVGLGALVEGELGVRLDKAKTLADWSRRPLQPALVRYAAEDVAYLLPLAERLAERLEVRRRTPMVEAECRGLVEPTAYRVVPEEVWQRVSGARRLGAREMGVLRALAAERERIASESDRPVQWILPDDVLVDLAARAPRVPAELFGGSRRPASGLREHGARWLEAIGLGLDSPVARGRARRPPTEGMEGVVSMAMQLVAAVARRNDVAPSLLCSRDALFEVVREMPASPSELSDRLGLESWRRDLLEEPLWAFLTGRLQLSVTWGETGPEIAFMPGVDQPGPAEG
jgi:ribonuclease D